ncbi:transposase [Streptomyces sp. NPDC046985]|uniref:transposase n=1 Tax=Streptomyces sp. NPDC046985 TaxID=3155377 RepID=UPI0033C1C217
MNSSEFREEAVQIALRSSKTVTEVARELDLNPETLRGWVKKHESQQEPSADELGLAPCRPKSKRFSLAKAGLPFPVPDLVGRHFTAENPGEKLVGDTTYVPTGEGWLYLATSSAAAPKKSSDTPWTTTARRR